MSLYCFYAFTRTNRATIPRLYVKSTKVQSLKENDDMRLRLTDFNLPTSRCTASSLFLVYFVQPSVRIVVHVTHLTIANVITINPFITIVISLRDYTAFSTITRAIALRTRKNSSLYFSFTTYFRSLGRLKTGAMTASFLYVTELISVPCCNDIVPLLEHRKL